MIDFGILVCIFLAGVVFGILLSSVALTLNKPKP